MFSSVLNEKDYVEFTLIAGSKYCKIKIYTIHFQIKKWTKRSEEHVVIVNDFMKSPSNILLALKTKQTQLWLSHVIGDAINSDAIVSNATVCVAILNYPLSIRLRY